VSLARFLVLLGLVLHAPLPLAADDYPSKPITIVIPYPAGGIVDVRVRQIADVATRQSAYRFIIENRPGAMERWARPTPLERNRTATRSCQAARAS
jgi:tripartite-type tricarboxylate transporter receptor subunit TctC